MKPKYFTFAVTPSAKNQAARAREQLCSGSIDLPRPANDDSHSFTYVHSDGFFVLLFLSISGS